MTSSDSTQTDSLAGSVLLSTYALVAVAGVMASLASDSFAWVAVTVLACAIHGFWTGSTGEQIMPERVADWLCFLAFAGGLAEKVLFDLSLTVSMAHFLTAVAVIVLFRHKEESHYRLLRLTVIVVTAIAATATEPEVFLFSFFGVACVLIWNHVALDISDSIKGHGAATDHISLAGTAIAVGLTALFISWFIYLTYPRVSPLQFRPGPSFQEQQQNKKKAQKTQTSIGFTESVSPGQIDTQAGGNELVMRVRYLQSGPGSSSIERPILMRGQVMGAYSNGSWEKYQSLPDQDSRLARSFDLDAYPSLARDIYVLENLPSRPRRVLQQIQVTSSNTRVLFCLARPVWASVDGRVGIGFDPVTHVLFTGSPPSGPRTYRIFSLRPQVPQSQLQDAAAMPVENVRGPFLQVPSNLEPHLERSMDTIRQRYNPGTDYDLVTAVKTYLRDSGDFDYTLAGPEMAGMDPIEAFLARTRTGSCTHFASAMVFLLRAQDIPARLVVGFRGGQPGEAGTTRKFYQKHAHAWVEVAFEDYGWLPFDPTPAGVMGEESFSSALARLKAMLQGPRSTWFNLFVGYGQEQQEQILKALRNLASTGLGELGQMAGRVLRVGGSIAAGVALLTVIVGILVAAVWAMRRFLWRSGRKREVPVEFYRRVISLLRKRGMQRPRHLTAREFAERAVRKLGEQKADSGRLEKTLRRLTELYYDVRYGGRALTADERQEADRLLDVLRDASSTSA